MGYVAGMRGNRRERDQLEDLEVDGGIGKAIRKRT